MVPGLFTSSSRNLGGKCAPTYKKRMRAARNTPSLPASPQREHSVSAGCLSGDYLKTEIKIWQDASAFSAMFRPLEASCSSTRLICRNCTYFHKKRRLFRFLSRADSLDVWAPTGAWNRAFSNDQLQSLWPASLQKGPGESFSRALLCIGSTKMRGPGSHPVLP